MVTAIKRRKRKKTKTAVELERVEVLTAVAKCFAYRASNNELARYYARKIVELLVKMKLVDATLPLRPDPPGGVDAPG